VEAESCFDAARQFTGKTNLIKLSLNQVDDAVIAAMCCRHEGQIEMMFERCQIDLDRVLLVDSYEHTSFYSTD